MVSILAGLVGALIGFGGGIMFAISVISHNIRNEIKAEHRKQSALLCKAGSQTHDFKGNNYCPQCGYGSITSFGNQ